MSSKIRFDFFAFLFVNFYMIDYEFQDPVNEEIRSGSSHLPLLLAQEVIDQSLTPLTILPSVNTQVREDFGGKKWNNNFEFLFPRFQEDN